MYEDIKTNKLHNAMGENPINDFDSMIRCSSKNNNRFANTYKEEETKNKTEKQERK